MASHEHIETQVEKRNVLPLKQTTTAYLGLSLYLRLTAL